MSRHDSAAANTKSTAAPSKLKAVGSYAPAKADVDRFSDVDLKVKLFEPVKQEHELLQEKLEDSVAPGDKLSVVEGDRYQLNLIAPRNERTIVRQSWNDLLCRRPPTDAPTRLSLIVARRRPLR